mgnify:CR=1 FL=1
MFYDNVHTNAAAISLLISGMDNLKLANNILDAYATVNLDRIDDEYTKEQVKVVKVFCDAVFEKQIRDKALAESYFREIKCDEEFSQMCTNLIDTYSSSIMEEYTIFWARVSHHVELDKSMEKLNDSWNRLRNSGVGQIEEYTKSFVNLAHDLDKKVFEFERKAFDNRIIMIDPNEEDEKTGLSNAEGYDKLIEEVHRNSQNRLKTGMWMDNITGGGFNGNSLYIIASISGGFKSGWLQNMAEYISCNTDPKTLKIPGKLKPCILYVNLELSQEQIWKRQVAFYEGNESEIMETIPGEDPNTRRLWIENNMRKLIKSRGAKIPVFYLSEDDTTRTFSANNLITKIRELEKQGWYTIGVITDYLDKFYFDIKNAPSERERDEPIVLKAYEHKTIAQKFNIPVITGAQLNTDGEKILKDNLKRANDQDIVRGLAADKIAKARQLTNVPEQIYFCYKYRANDEDYFALVVDKDRDGVARYIPKDEDSSIKQNEKAGYRKGQDNRVYYISRFDINDVTGRSSFRISDDYKSSIQDYTTYSEDFTVFSDVSPTEGFEPTSEEEE